MPYIVSDEEVENLSAKPCYTCRTKSVFEHPLELFRSMNVYPFYNGFSLNLDNNKKLNALVRSIFIVLVIWSFLFSGSTGVKTSLTYLVLLFLILEVMYQLGINPFTQLNQLSTNGLNGRYVNSSGQLIVDGIPRGYLDSNGVPYHIKPSTNAQEEVCEEYPGSCLPLINRDLVWDGSALVNRTGKLVAPALASPSNEYGNPLLTNYDTAVRANQSSAFDRTYGDNLMEKAFMVPEYTSMDLYMNQVPNETLISRPFLSSTTGDFRGV